MKLARYADENGAALGLITARGLIPIARHLPEVPTDMIKLITEWDSYKRLIAGLADISGCLSLADVKLLAPIARPGKILRNF
jgi:hypothetical protein